MPTSTVPQSLVMQGQINQAGTQPYAVTSQPITVIVTFDFPFLRLLTFNLNTNIIKLICTGILSII